MLSAGSRSCLNQKAEEMQGKLVVDVRRSSKHDKAKAAKSNLFPIQRAA